MSSRVLVVDDEPAIVDTVSYALAQEGFSIDRAGDGETALQAIREGSFDVVVLDIRLPKLSGVEVCRRARAESAVPIIMLTAKDAEVDRVIGLEAGADDYVTKPFSMAELVSRVRALLRRRDLDRHETGSTMRQVGDVTIDLTQHVLSVGERRVQLTASELKLLALLAGEPGRAFTRREIMQHLWQSDYVADARACDVHVANIRRKIEHDPARALRLQTVRGVGYRLVPTAAA
jgi:two-component system, OmpR family, response regulator RegX3